ncbi:response regulator transcription factor [Candidatus Gracilibacteria bacterium 28_42_T64]|nr:response regulator transcription factor [Candidatus Gracilibacteria bacterium 28_42_T64]
MKILLIEDNKDISENIKKVLEYENTNFLITQKFDGEEGIKEFLLGEYDLILLDLMLPKIDGITLCNRIRLKSEVPIIMMTARGEDDDKILGLESGADDYIVKPFKVRELQARIKAIAKRLHIDEVIILGDIGVDFTKKIIKKNNTIISLKTKEFLVLEFIYKNNTVSKSDLIEHIWGSQELFGGDNKLDVYIYSLRKKLGKDIIKTIKGFGYSIIHTDEN